MRDPIFASILTNLAVQLPVLLTILVGMIICFVKWKNNPKASLFGFLGLLLLFINVITASLGTFLPFLLTGRFGMKYADVGIVLTIFNLLISIGGAIAYVFLIVAIFVGRKAKKVDLELAHKESVELK